MSQKDSVSSGSTDVGHQAKVMEELRAKTNSELLEEIDKLMSAPEDGMDVERITLCESILQERAPVCEDYDAEAEWQRIKDGQPRMLEDDGNVPEPRRAKPRPKRRLRILRTVEVAVAAMLCLVITAEAFGYHPFNAIQNWIADVLQIGGNPSGIMELPEGTDSEYRSLREALDANGFEDADCPTWIPEDYCINDITITLSDAVSKFVSYYESERGNLYVRVTKYLDEDWSQFEEQEVDNASLEINGKEYQIMSNTESVKVVWNDNSFYYTLSGQISEDEVKRIIESIE